MEIAYHDWVRKTQVILAIFVVGLILRLFAVGKYPLRFDQVQILQAADKIRAGHPTLIGPRTGPAEMFTGPLVYYVAALASFASPYPYAAVGMSIIIFAVTYWALWFISRRYQDDRFVQIFLGFYALSALMAVLDRTPWNPNLSFLSGALVFFPLMQLWKKRNLEILDDLLLGAGMFLGYQAHFSGLILPAVALVVWVVASRKFRTLATIVLGTLISLLPTVLFDYKYHWLNLRGFLALIQNNQTGRSLNPLSLVGRLGHDLLTIMYNQGRILIFDTPLLQQAILGLIVVIGYAWMIRKKKASLFPLIFILLFVVPFALYTGTKPEYYFLMIFPVLTFMLAQITAPILSQMSLKLALVGFALFSFAALYPEVMGYSGLTIGDQTKAVAYARELLKENPHQALVFDIATADQVGLKYLLADTSTNEGEAVKLHFIFPASDQDPASKRFGSLAVWQDPRIDPQRNYIQIKQLTISTPHELVLYTDLYPRTQFVSAETSFVVFSDDKKMGSVYIFDDQIEKDFTLKTFINSIASQWDQNRPGWQIVSTEGKKVLIQKIPHKFVITDVAADIAPQITFVSPL